MHRRSTLEAAHRTSGLSYLVVLISRRYLDYGAERGLQETLKKDQTAVAAIPPHDPFRGAALISLADLVHERYRRGGSFQDFNYVLRITFGVWHCHM